MRPAFARLPYGTVNRIDAVALTVHLGLKPAHAKRKFACLACNSSDGMHAYPNGGFFCFSCNGRWTNVDAMAASFRKSPREACRDLAETFSIELGTVSQFRLSSDVVTRNVAPHGPEADHGDAFEELRKLGTVPSLPAVIYTAIVEHLALGPKGSAYLAKRNLDPSQCAGFGLRSIETARQWSQLNEFLRDSWMIEELQEAAIIQFPWRGIQPAILLPYWSAGEVSIIRFRALSNVTPKYRSLRGRRILFPFNSAALEGSEGCEIHVTEGEIDALTLHLASHRAVGLPGAGVSKAPLLHIANSVKCVSRLIIWRDSDNAGDRFVTRVCEALGHECGSEWVQSRVIVRRLRGSKDVNELAQRFGLEALCR